MSSAPRTRSELLTDNAELRARLDEAEEMLRAIRDGEIDALVVESADGPHVYTLQGLDAEANRARGEMLAQVSDAVIAVDSEDRIIYLNAAAERLYGFSTSQALGRILSEIYESRWLHADDEGLATVALHERGEWRGDNVHVTRGGRALDVESGVTVLRDTSGHCHGRLAVIRDVTERKRHEQKVLISEIRYRRLFETAHDGILILDPNTSRIIDANPYMTLMLGRRHADLVGKELFEVGLREDRAASQKMLRELKRLRQVKYENIVLYDQDGDCQEVDVVANLYEENGRYVIQCNIRDITERRRSEEHVKLLMAEVNHRAKNLLAVVQAVAYQTGKQGDPSTFATRLSERIEGLAAGHDLLVKNQWRAVEAAELVTAQLSHFKDLIGTRVILEGGPAGLTAEAAQGIGMALHELATNAAKYGALSTREGKVRVAWHVTNDVTPTFSISWTEYGGPPVSSPSRKGFGQMVIGPMAEAAVQGVATTVFSESGVIWTLVAPALEALAVIRGVAA